MTSLEKHIIKGIRLGNVTQVTSTCPWLNSQSLTESFTYDASDQLVSASETQAQSYQLAVTYGNWGRIDDYSLLHTELWSGTTTHDHRSFAYPNDPYNPQQAQTLFAPEMHNGTSDVTYSFGINGSLRKREEHSPNPCTEYYLFNSAANLKAYSYDALDFAYYGYNASNTRAYKLSMLNTNQWVNGEPEPVHLQPQQAMLYPNAYVNFNQNGEYTKHYYSGTERICSRLGDAYVPMTASADSRTWVRRLRADALFRGQVGELVSGDEPSLPSDRGGGGTREPVSPDVEYSPVTTLTALMPTGNPDDIFYYHTNHLGSTAYVTDQNRNITQGFLYAPFGEITTEYAPLWQNGTLPKYAFNAKELDEETGMYYYEARYYKPPVFTSRDPMFEKYFWMTPYAYCANNPVKYVDPSGCDLWIVDFEENGSSAHAVDYKPGMKYDGDNKYIKNAVDRLNEMYSTENGKTVIESLENSTNLYTIEGKCAKDSRAAGSFTEYNDCGIISLPNSKMTLQNISHELFHAYQYETFGGGTCSISSEVEAYLFAYSVVFQFNPESVKKTGLESVNYNRVYDKALRSLMQGVNFEKNFNLIVHNFKKEAEANHKSLYNDHRLFSNSSLINSFLPIYNKK